MIGWVDDDRRALLTLPVQQGPKRQAWNVDAWVDTAFDGHFVFSMKLIEELGLETLAETEAILADGTKVVLETFLAYLEWFGNVIPVQVVANEGTFPLLGTALLDGHRLMIDYRDRSLELS